MKSISRLRKKMENENPNAVATAINKKVIKYDEYVVELAILKPTHDRTNFSI